jgi:hypothetical protein
LCQLNSLFRQPPIIARVCIINDFISLFQANPQRAIGESIQPYYSSCFLSGFAGLKSTRKPHSHLNAVCFRRSKAEISGLESLWLFPSKRGRHLFGISKKAFQACLKCNVRSCAYVISRIISKGTCMSGIAESALWLISYISCQQGFHP